MYTRVQVGTQSIIFNVRPNANVMHACIYVLVCAVSTMLNVPDGYICAVQRIFSHYERAITTR